MPVNTKYPNMPDDFPEAVRAQRYRLGISMTTMSMDLGVVPATISQLELRRRNFTYERAVQFRDYLKMDVELPVPDLEKRKPIIRPRRTNDVEHARFIVKVDGELIEVLTWRRLGPIKQAETV